MCLAQGTKAAKKEKKEKEKEKRAGLHENHWVADSYTLWSQGT
jgi:hypothetical protein